MALYRENRTVSKMRCHWSGSASGGSSGRVLVRLALSNISLFDFAIGHDMTLGQVIQPIREDITARFLLFFSLLFILVKKITSNRPFLSTALAFLTPELLAPPTSGIKHLSAWLKHQTLPNLRMAA